MADLAWTPNASATLGSLPNDILGRVVGPLSFQDKFSLEHAGKGFHTLLSNPLSSERLWGRCDLMSDLKLDDNFDRREDIMRWLSHDITYMMPQGCDLIDHIMITS